MMPRYFRSSDLFKCSFSVCKHKHYHNCNYDSDGTGTIFGRCPLKLEGNAEKPNLERYFGKTLVSLLAKGEENWRSARFVSR